MLFFFVICCCKLSHENLMVSSVDSQSGKLIVAKNASNLVKSS